MNLEYLAHFLVIAEQKNITRAALKLHFSQPALSRQMGSLEKQLGHELFVRDSHVFQLTEAGEILARESRSLLNQFELLKSRLDGTAGRSDILQLTFSVISPVYVFDLNRRFMKNHPGAILTLDDVEGTGAILANLADNVADFGMLNSYEVGDLMALSGEYAYKTLWHDRMAVITSHDHPLAAAGRCSIDELRAERLLQIGASGNPHLNYINFACREHNIFPPLQGIYPAKNKDTMLFLVKSGFGIAFMPLEIARGYTAEVSVVEISDLAIEMDFMLVWKRSNSNPAVPIFVDLLDNSQQPTG